MCIVLSCKSCFIDMISIPILAVASILATATGDIGI